MEDKEYITILGDTFDLIAYKVLGDSKAYKKIIDLNPEYSGIIFFKAGIKLKVPKEEIKVDANIAPWRR